MTEKICRGPNDKRSQIILAAIRVFSHKGFHRSKVEEIAVEAGVGKGTVYEYFSSKKDVFKEMLYFVSDRYKEEFSRRQAGAHTLQEKIKAIFMTHLEFLQKHKDMARIIWADHPAVGEEVRDWMLAKRREMIGYISRLIGREIEDGHLRPVDENLAACIVMGVQSGLAAYLLFDRQDLDVEEVAGQAVDLLLDAWQAKSSL